MYYPGDRIRAIWLVLAVLGKGGRLRCTYRDTVVISESVPSANGYLQISAFLQSTYLDPSVDFPRYSMFRKSEVRCSEKSSRY
jgi:hypothetical protein